MSDIDLIWRYQEIVKYAKLHDSCLGMNGDAGIIFSKKIVLLEDKKERYWKYRSILEAQISHFVRDIRIMIEKIPDEYKKTHQRSSLNQDTGEVDYYEVYDDSNYSSLIKYYEKIIQNIEGYNGILKKLEDKIFLYDDIRNLRGFILMFYENLELFKPQNIIEIDKYVKLLYKMKEQGMKDVSDNLEKIEETESNIEKCTLARSNLEQYTIIILKLKKVDIKKGFFSNLDLAIENQLIKKEKREIIASNYSYLSKIIHKEIIDSNKNTLYGISMTLQILTDLIS